MLSKMRAIVTTIGVGLFLLLLSFPSSTAQDTTMAAMYTVDMLTTSNCILPTSAAFVVECQDDGILRALEDDEGLDLTAACTASDDNPTSKMSCVVSNLWAVVGSTVASLVFACEGTTDASRLATVTVEEDSHDCLTASFGIGTYGRELSVALVCPTVPQFVTFPVVPQSFQCSQGSQSSALSKCSVKATCGAFSSPACTTDAALGGFSLTVTDISTTTPCLWNEANLSSGRNVVANTPLDDTLEATYNVVLSTYFIESPFGDTCTFDAPSQITVSCGEEGEMVSEDLDSTASCTRVDAGTFECFVDANALASLELSAISVLVSCRGSTRESLAVDVSWDPQSMECTESPVNPGNEAATIGYNLAVYQTCIPPQEYASTAAQQCSPIIATQYTNFTNNVYDIDLAGELCGMAYFTCQVSGQCDDQGKQKLGRVKAYVLAEDVDLRCAGGTDFFAAQEGDGGDGNAGSQAGDGQDGNLGIQEQGPTQGGEADPTDQTNNIATNGGNDDLASGPIVSSIFSRFLVTCTFSSIGILSGVL
jgi:hypothetical protein